MPSKSQGTLISIVIPTHDRRRILERCLDGTLAQTYEPYEVIVVDDASSDGTSEFVEQFSSQHPERTLRVLVNDHNMGSNQSRNRGIREASGTLIAFLDSDCIAEPDWLEQIASGFCTDDVAAVVGIVKEPEPTNIFELTFKGTNRVHGRGEAPRLVAGNMCVRRDLLLRYPLDEDLEYGCDEEGTYLRLKAAGFQQRLEPNAIVLHEHYYSGREFFRAAYVGGAGAAWLVYKYRLPPRLDLLPLILMYLALPLCLWGWPLCLVPAIFGTLFVSAITYNELFRKRKTIAETLFTFPVLLLYYQVRLLGYLAQAIRLRTGSMNIQRVGLGNGGLDE